MEYNLQEFLALLCERDASLASRLQDECFQIMKTLIGAMGESFEPGVYDMAEQIYDALENYKVK